MTVFYDVINVGVFGTAQFWGDRVVWNTTQTLAGGIDLITQCRNFPNFILPSQSYSTFGANNPLQVQVPSVPTGIYFVGFDANLTRCDPGPCTPGPWAVFESNLNNNTLWVQVQVTVPTNPAFTCQNLVVTPSTAAPGSSVNVSFNVANVGGSLNNGSVAAAVFLSTTPSSSSTVLATGPFVVVAAGASLPISIPLQIPQVPLGNYYVVVDCAYFGGVPTSSTSQQLAAAPITISVPAAATPYGNGCGGSNEPLLAALNPPALGTVCNLLITNQAGYVPTILYLGSSNTVAGSISLPFDLSPFGMTGCEFLVSPDASETLINAGTTIARPLPIPSNSAILGSTYYLQALALIPVANPAGIVTSSGLALRIGT